MSDCPACANLRDALESMCRQYLSVRDGKLHHDFMSAGEAAFEALGWDDDGHPVDPACLCDVPGCGSLWTNGQPDRHGVYRRTCDAHKDTIAALVVAWDKHNNA
jgi:hypothetical protein